MTKKFWQGGVNEIIGKILNGKRTIQDAKFYMEYKFVGDSREAFNHKAYIATSADQTAEMTVYNMLNDAIKLGYGKDSNFERVFR